MYKWTFTFGFAAFWLLSFGSSSLGAECTLWHTECVYVCIQTYPDGTCKKTKKVCHKVCDEFDVKPSHKFASSPTAQPSGQAGVEKPVTGTLRKIVGGESPGWDIELDSPLFFDKQKFTHLEVDPKGQNAAALTGKRVRIDGQVEWRKGMKRGMHPVIVVASIEGL
jgi:hypothetical protein